MIRVVVKLALIFILVFAGVKIWYSRMENRLLDTAVLPQSAAAEASAVEEQTLPRPENYTIITERNIFQAEVNQADVVRDEPVAKELEQTKLKLSLMGTISGNERDARAIISDDIKNKQDIYQVGDSIQGALIKNIERGRVILEVNGMDEVLTLAERQGGGPAYEPSPADFYQEPPEEQFSPEPAMEEEPYSQPPDAGTSQVMPGPEPMVRPRPFRRPNIQQRSPGGLEQPDGDNMGNPPDNSAEEEIERQQDVP